MCYKVALQNNSVNEINAKLRLTRHKNKVRLTKLRTFIELALTTSYWEHKTINFEFHVFYEIICVKMYCSYFSHLYL